MSRTTMGSFAAAGALATGVTLAGLALAGHTPSRAAEADSCAAYGDMKFICGLSNAEDLMPLPDSKWIVSGGMSGQDMPGHFYLIDSEAKTAEVLFPGDDPKLKQDTKIFGLCPGPLDVTKFSVHGLSLRPESAGHYKMYITSHGAREAVEAFSLDTTGAKPALTWVGCVPLPEEAFSNSVAILPDGGFVVTKFIDKTVQNAFGDILQGKVTGVVYEWHPGDAAVKPVAGTETSGPNGIDISKDGKTMYLAVMGEHSVVKYALGAAAKREGAAKLDILVDNVHWGPNGKLLAGGGMVPPPGAGPGGRLGWKVYEIDPDTMAAKELAHMDGKAPLPSISVGMVDAGLLWVGTPRGDRVGYLPVK